MTGKSIKNPNITVAVGFHNCQIPEILMNISKFNRVQIFLCMQKIDSIKCNLNKISPD